MPGNYKRKRTGTNRSRKPRYNNAGYSKKRGKYSKKFKNMANNRLIDTSFRMLGTGFPDVLYTKLKYFENNYEFGLDGTQFLRHYDFMLNNPYDPYGHLGGKSAAYYDEYMNVYGFCRVIAAKITISVARISDNNEAITYALVPNFLNSSYLDIDDVCAHPHARVVHHGLSRVGDATVLTYYAPINMIFGHTKLQYMSQAPGTAYDSSLGNPTNLARMQLWWSRYQEGSATVVAAKGTVKIIFYCKFYQRRQNLQRGPDVDEDTLDTGEVAKETE